MDLVEIHVVEPEPLQGGGDLIHDVAARQADRVRPRPHPAANLGGDDHVLALDAEIAQRLAELNFGLPFGVDVGRVDEIDARFERAADERRGGLLVERPDGAPEPGAAAEGHGAEADFGDILAGAAERSIAHEASFLVENAPRHASASGNLRRSRFKRERLAHANRSLVNEASPSAARAREVSGGLSLDRRRHGARSSSPPRPTS